MPSCMHGHDGFRWPHGPCTMHDSTNFRNSLWSSPVGISAETNRSTSLDDRGLLSVEYQEDARVWKASFLKLDDVSESNHASQTVSHGQVVQQCTQLLTKNTCDQIGSIVRFFSWAQIRHDFGPSWACRHRDERVGPAILGDQSHRIQEALVQMPRAANERRRQIYRFADHLRHGHGVGQGRWCKPLW